MKIEIGSSVFKLIGLVFLIIGISGTVIFIFIQVNKVSNYEEYDQVEIRSKGVPLTARVNKIDINSKVAVNGRNPFLVEYAFFAEGNEYFDKFQTFDDMARGLAIGDEINIYYWGNQSVPANMETYKFPMQLFILLPLIMLVIGSFLFFFMRK